MEAEPNSAQESGFPELTNLGKRIEMLRIERGLSKQYLARYAGTSRQQLWRVMTGKSELTGALRSRLADALNVAPLEFDIAFGPATSTGTTSCSSRRTRAERHRAACSTDGIRLRGGRAVLPRRPGARASR